MLWPSVMDCQVPENTGASYELRTREVEHYHYLSGYDLYYA